MTIASGKTCFIDFGHHTLFGHILTELKLALGSRMFTVRLRRGRLQTASSFGDVHIFKKQEQVYFFFKANFILPAINYEKDGPCADLCTVNL